MEEELKTKLWKTAGTFSTYEEADRLRRELIGKHTLFKVKNEFGRVLLCLLASLFKVLSSLDVLLISLLNFFSC